MVQEIFKDPVCLHFIGLALLGFNQLTQIFQEPVPGLISLWFLLLVVVYRYDEYNRGQPYKLPFRISGVLVAAILGCVVYYSMAAGKVSWEHILVKYGILIDFANISIVELPDNPVAGYKEMVAYYPHPSNFYHLIGKAITTYGSIAVPYAILVNIHVIYVPE